MMKLNHLSEVVEVVAVQDSFSLELVVPVVWEFSLPGEGAAVGVLTVGEAAFPSLDSEVVELDAEDVATWMAVVEGSVMALPFQHYRKPHEVEGFRGLVQDC